MRARAGAAEGLFPSGYVRRHAGKDVLSAHGDHEHVHTGRPFLQLEGTGTEVSRRYPQGSGNRRRAGLPRQPARQNRHVEACVSDLFSARGDATPDDANLLFQDQGLRLLGVAQQPEQNRAADSRVTRERQLGCRREDAQPRRVRRIGRGQHKHRLRQVELAGNRLHAPRIQAVAVLNHRQRVAGEPLFGEDVKGAKSALHRLVRNHTS